MLSSMEKLKHGQTASIPNYNMNTRKRIEPPRQVLTYISKITNICFRPDTLFMFWFLVGSPCRYHSFRRNTSSSRFSCSRSFEHEDLC